MSYFVRSFITAVLISMFPLYARAEEALTWQACVAEAAKNHPDLISAKESVKQSEAQKKISASRLLPQVDATLGASTSTSISRKAGSETSDSYSYGVSGSQLLFDGNKTVNQVKAAGEGVKAASYNYNFTSSEVRFRLRSAFISLLRAQELLTITQEIYNIRRGNLELITLRYQSGMEHEGALLTAQANLAQASFEISQANRGLEVARRQLIKEMGRKAFAPIKVSGDFALVNTVKEKPDFDAIVNANPSLLSLAAKINQANFSLRSAYDNFFPSLSAQSGAGRSDTHWPPKNDQWDVGLSLSLPIFEGGLRFAQVSQAGSVLDQAKANERSGRDALVVALEGAWAGLQDAEEALDVQQKFLDAAQMRARIAEAQYSTGFISYDNWTIIEDDLVRNKKTFLDTRANALLAEANWIQAKGETLEYAQ